MEFCGITVKRQNVIGTIAGILLPASGTLIVLVFRLVTSKLQLLFCILTQFFKRFFFDWNASFTIYQI